MRRLNRYKVIEIWWLSGIENFVSERNYFIFNSFRNFKPVKRFQNKSNVLNFGAWTQFEQDHSGCVRDDLFENSEDHYIITLP